MSRAPLARMLAVARDRASLRDLLGLVCWVALLAILKAPSLAEGVWGWVSFALAVASLA
ncbi:hypothetical protein [Helicobacter macacae]|uniref:hypothetical protein n=1 Tax=Helicobacter macacae TaxID=398626 RepID=UPI0012EB2E01|nr:hypothetical protein [Helicobacter macacae]